MTIFTDPTQVEAFFEANRQAASLHQEVVTHALGEVVVAEARELLAIESATLLALPPEEYEAYTRGQSDSRHYDPAIHIEVLTFEALALQFLMDDYRDESGVEVEANDPAMAQLTVRTRIDDLRSLRSVSYAFGVQDRVELVQLDQVIDQGEINQDRPPLKADPEFSIEDVIGHLKGYVAAGQDLLDLYPSEVQALIY